MLKLTLNAAVAGTHVDTADAGGSSELQLRQVLLEVTEGSRGIKQRQVGRRLLLDLSVGLGLGSNRLSETSDDLSIDLCTLDQPVVAAVASNTIVHAILAEVKVTVVTGGAVVVDVGGRRLAAVAANSKPRALNRGNAQLPINRRRLLLFINGCWWLAQSLLALLLHVCPEAGKSGLELAAEVRNLRDLSGFGEER